MTFKKGLLASGLIFGSMATVILTNSYSPAHAETRFRSNKSNDEPSSWYLTVGSGLITANEADSTWKETGFTDISTSFDYDTAFTGIVGIGYDFGSIRTEATYGYASMTTNSLSFAADGTKVSAPLATTMQNHSFNVGSFFDVTTSNKVSPYVGARLGVVSSTLDALSVTVDGTSVSTNEDSVSAFTYELLGGLSYQASDKTDLFVEAGWLGIANREFDLGSSNTIDMDGTGVFTTKIGFRYRM